MASITGTTSNLASSSTASFMTARRASDPFAKTFGSALSSGVSPPSGTSSNLNDLRQASEQSLSEFTRSLKQLFHDAGIDTSQMIRLEPDDHGGITVVGHHPDADKIEKIFEENPDLAAKFQTLAQKFKDLRAAENKPRDEQPLIGPTFGLSIMNDEFQVAFQ